MNDKFVPLALPGKPAGDSGNTVFRLKVASHADGQPVMPTSNPPSTNPLAPPSVTNAPGNSTGNAEVKLERDAQQRISRILVQCGCGQAHELDCSYD